MHLSALSRSHESSLFLIMNQQLKNMFWNPQLRTPAPREVPAGTFHRVRGVSSLAGGPPHPLRPPAFYKFYISWDGPHTHIIYIYIYTPHTYIPVVPHKAVAEVSRVGNYRRDWLLWVTDGRAKTLMDRTVQLCNWLTDYLTDCRTD